MLLDFSVAGDPDNLITYSYSLLGNSTTTSFLPENTATTPIGTKSAPAPLPSASATYNLPNLGEPDFVLPGGPSPYQIPGSSRVAYFGADPDPYWIFPVALDLDGDGVELVSKENSRAYFDVKGDGFRRNVGWVGTDDAFLAIDKNADGKISEADELSFAPWTADYSDTDIQALKTVLDTNGDSVTDAGELKILAERGITAINLTAAQTDWASGGNRITGFITYSKTDGTNGWAADVGLGYEADGWRATVESSLMRVTQSGGLVYGLGNNTLRLDMSGAEQEMMSRISANLVNGVADARGNCANDGVYQYAA